MNRDARRLANRHQTRNHRIGVVLGRTDDLRPDRGRDAAHHVMDGRDHRDRLLARIDAGENARRLNDAREARAEDIRRQLLEMQVDVVLLLTDAAALADLDRLGPADHVARGEVLFAGCIFGHEALALAVGQIAALAAGALGNQNARAINPGRVELDELHVLQRETSAQYHRVAVAGAGVRRGAGLVNPAAAAGRNDSHICAEPVDRPVLETPGEEAAAGAVLVHQEVDGKIFYEEARLVLEG